MTGGAIVANDANTITVRVPIAFANRQTGKKIVPPLGAPEWAPAAPRIDNALVRAVVRGHRWRAMLETGDYASIKELATKDKVNESYVCRLLRLTLLAPTIIESILNGTQPKQIQLDDLIRPMPADWKQQVSVIASIG